MPTLFSQPKTEKAYIADVVMEMFSSRYNFDEVDFTNELATDIDLVPGEALRVDTGVYHVTDTDDDAVRINLSKKVVPAGESCKIKVLGLRGPAIVNEAAITCQSAAVRATVITNLKTAYGNPVVFVDEPALIQRGPIV